MFNLSNATDLPEITDVINTSSFPMNFMQMFTYMWVWFLGGWFFAGVIGVLACALYIKTDHVMPSVAFLIVMSIIYGNVLRAVPEMSSMGDASYFVYMVGVLISFAIGFLFYKLFVDKK